jgi:cytidyltransferase-related domain
MNRIGRFSKAELEKMLGVVSNIGKDNTPTKDRAEMSWKFYYPVPDMRMPQMIFTDSYMKGINARERLNDYNYHDYPMHLMEHRLFGDVIDGGALPFMSDSFIVEITVDGELSDIEYAVVTTDRGGQLGMATTIRRSNQNRVVVKRPLNVEGEKQIRLLNSYTEELAAKEIPIVPTSLKSDEFGTYLEMPYIEYEGLSGVLEKMITSDRAGFLQMFDAIYLFICRSAAECKNIDNDSESDIEPGVENESMQKIGRVFLDLAPCNAFYIPGKENAEDSILFYDQEFVSNDATPKYVMYRTIRYFFESSPASRAEMDVTEMFRRYGISKEDEKAFAEKEKQFIASVRNTDEFAWVVRASKPNIKSIDAPTYDVDKAADTAENKPYHIGYVPGVFDLFHKGHLRLIERCKERCDILIVGVLTDELVEYYKGKKPVISLEDRMEVIEGLRAVDRVIPVDFSNTDKIAAWEQLHYDCHFSGDDHVGHWNDILEELRKRGSNMEFFSYTEGISSTEIKNTMKQ